MANYSLINGSAATNVAGSTIAGPSLNVQNANAQITSVAESAKIARREFINPASTGNTAFITGTTLGAVDNFTKFIDSTPGDQIASLATNAKTTDTCIKSDASLNITVFRGEDGQFYNIDGYGGRSKVQQSDLSTGVLNFGADNAVTGTPQINFRFGKLNATGVL